ncbi:MAG: enolase C-terminal domain-like protein [Pirellulaceae bacterium]|nr:hypothetical protein [Planctomycetales bacterium]
MPDRKRSTDVHVVYAELYLLPIRTRVPLKFGSETLTSVTCARVRVVVEGELGHFATGWGETPLSVQWVWPAATSYQERHEALKAFSRHLVDTWVGHASPGHALEIGCDFLEHVLPAELKRFNAARAPQHQMPHLAALVCASPFDLAVHDAYGNLHQVPTYDTYNARYLSRDLSSMIVPDADCPMDLRGKYPADFLVTPAQQTLLAWHLVGGLDPLSEDELTDASPDDGHPVLLADWITRDGLQCLKIKLRGNDAQWDFRRLLRVGTIGIEHGVRWLTADFNCTVTDPQYVNEILDQLQTQAPEIHGKLLYVEQPFPYELDEFPIDVHSVSSRSTLLMDESAHDWRQVQKGRALGWSGVALKTCKTQTGALLSLAWAKAHGMPVMVQDLTNPMLAQITHLSLAAHADTMMGVETNSMQFYPAVSELEGKIHTGAYQRRDGIVRLNTLGATGFGYRVDEIGRPLPPPVATAGDASGILCR